MIEKVQTASHVYDGASTFMRGQEITVKYKGSDTKDALRKMVIDGNSVEYGDKITWKCLPKSLEVLFNSETYFESSHAFVTNHLWMINSKSFREGQLLRTITKLQALNDNQDQLQEQVERYFKEFDKDQNGYLDRQELAEFLVQLFKRTKLTIPLSEEFIDTVFEDIDRNNDGRIVITELYPYFTDFLVRLVDLFETTLEETPDKVISSHLYSNDELNKLLSDF